MTKSMQEKFKGSSLFRFCLWRLKCLIGKGVCWAGCSLARGANRARTATPLDIGNQGTADQAERWSAILQRLADILLPYGVAEEFEASEIDTLIVVPITVKKFNPLVDEEKTSSTRVTIW